MKTTFLVHWSTSRVSNLIIQPWLSPSFKAKIRTHLFYIRLLGRFAPIFYLNCEHDLFVCILKQRRKIFCGLSKKKSRIFKNLNFFFTKLKVFKTHFSRFLSFINLPCGHGMSLKKFGPDQFWRLLGTNKQTDRQTSQIYI